MNTKIKISIFLFLFFLQDGNFFAGSINIFDPLYEMNLRKKKIMFEKMLRRFVFSPFYIFIDGETIEKIITAVFCIGFLSFHFLKKNNKSEGEISSYDINKYEHICLFGFLLQWFIFSPIIIFINAYIDEYDKILKKGI